MATLTDQRVRRIGLSALLCSMVSAGGSRAVGPGDPTTVFFRDPVLGQVHGLVAASDGCVYAAHGGNSSHPGGGGILHVCPGEHPFALRTEPVSDLAMDGFGNLLVSTPRVIRRLSDDGNFVDFTPQQYDRFDALTVSPTGDVWVVGTDGGRLLRLTRAGAFVEAIPLPTQDRVLDLAYSADSVLHLLTATHVYTLARTLDQSVGVTSGDYERVYEHPTPRLRGMAFDAAGNTYLAAGTDRVIKLGREYQPEAAPFAMTTIGDVRTIAFLRSTYGTPTRRILVAGLGDEIVQLNSEGVDAQGAENYPRALTPEDLVAELFGAARLAAEDRSALDRRGNQNNLYDVGDVRAYLLMIGDVPLSARSRAGRPQEEFE